MNYQFGVILPFSKELRKVQISETNRLSGSSACGGIRETHVTGLTTTAM